MKKALAFIFSLSLLLSACMLPVNEIAVRGSGKVITETRTVQGINRVNLSNFAFVKIIQGSEEGLEITGEDNLLPHILTRINGSTLDIRSEENVNLYPTRDLTITLKVKDISVISVSSSGSVSMDQLNAQRLELNISSSGGIKIGALTAADVRARISSSGNVELSGQTDSQDINISSSGDYRAYGLQSQSAYINVSSSGTAEVWVLKTLNVQLSSSGNVYYYGGAVLISRTTSSGKVFRKGDQP